MCLSRLRSAIATSASGSRPQAASAAATRPSRARRKASSNCTSASKSSSAAAPRRPACPSPPASARRRSAPRCTCSSSRSRFSHRGLTKPETSHSGWRRKTGGRHLKEPEDPPNDRPSGARASKSVCRRRFPDFLEQINWTKNLRVHTLDPI